MKYLYLVSVLFLVCLFSPFSWSSLLGIFVWISLFILAIGLDVSDQMVLEYKKRSIVGQEVKI